MRMLTQSPRGKSCRLELKDERLHDPSPFTFQTKLTKIF